MLIIKLTKKKFTLNKLMMDSFIQRLFGSHKLEVKRVYQSSVRSVKSYFFVTV